MNDIFTGYGIQNLLIFFCQYFKDAVPCILVTISSNQSSASIYIVVSLYIRIIFSCLLSRFSIIDFQQLDYNAPKDDILYLSSSELVKLFKYIDVHIPKLKFFQPLFLKIFFSSIFFSSLSDIMIICMLYFCDSIPQVFKAAYFSFSAFTVL